MIRMTVYAGAGTDDEDGPYEPSTIVRLVAERDMSEELRKLGLEWRQADYFPTRQTVITLDPMPDQKPRPDPKGLMAPALEAWRVSAEYADDDETMAAIDRLKQVFL